MDQQDGISTSNLNPAEVRLLAAVGYLPMLFFLPLLVGHRHRFCKFHGMQSLVLLIAFALIWLAILLFDFLFGNILGRIIIFGFIFKISAWIVHYLIGTSVSLLYFILIVYCFIQAAAGQEWEVPLIAAYTRRIMQLTD